MNTDWTQSPPPPVLMNMIHHHHLSLWTGSTITTCPYEQDHILIFDQLFYKSGLNSPPNLLLQSDEKKATCKETTTKQTKKATCKETTTKQTKKATCKETTTANRPKKSNMQRNNHKTDQKKQHAKKQPQNRQKKQYSPYTQSMNAIKYKKNNNKTKKQYFPLHNWWTLKLNRQKIVSHYEHYKLNIQQSNTFPLHNLWTLQVKQTTKQYFSSSQSMNTTS